VPNSYGYEKGIIGSCGELLIIKNHINRGG